MLYPWGHVKVLPYAMSAKLCIDAEPMSLGKIP